MSTEVSRRESCSGRATSWAALVGAITVEIIATTALPAAQGFTRPLIGLAAAAGFILSFYLLTLATMHIPLGVAYAMWCALGTVAVSLTGILVLHQPMSLGRWAGVFLVMAGVCVLNMSTVPRRRGRRRTRPPRTGRTEAAMAEIDVLEGS